MPPAIAQLVTPSDGSTSGFGAMMISPFAPSIYILNNITMYRYDYVMETQSPAATVAIGPGGGAVGGWDIDKSGNVLLEQHPGNAAIYSRYDGTSLALLGTSGTIVGAPSYPGTFVAGQGTRCVAVFPAAVPPDPSNRAAAVGYAVTMTYGYEYEVEVFFTAPFGPAGFGGASYRPADANTLAVTCLGETLTHVGVVYIAFGSAAPTNPTSVIHKITITAGAETYSIASWPTPNSHITAGPIGTLRAVDIVPGATFISIRTMAAVDGGASILLYANVGTAGPSSHALYLVKIRTTDASIVWVAPCGSTSDAPQYGTDLGRSKLGSSMIVLTPNAWRITAVASGANTDYPLTGLVPAGAYFNGFIDASDDAISRAVFNGNFTQDATSPLPVVGTPSAFTGWALVENVIVPPNGGGGGGGGDLRLAMDNVIATVIGPQPEVNLISLRWSDDRGHSWGSWVTQPIGEAGEYRTSLQWQRLAYARDRVFEISWSVPMRTALQGAWIDVTPAQS